MKGKKENGTYRTNLSNIKIYPNGVDLIKFPFMGPSESSTIIFIGNMNPVIMVNDITNMIGA